MIDIKKLNCTVDHMGEKMQVPDAEDDEESFEVVGIGLIVFLILKMIVDMALRTDALLSCEQHLPTHYFRQSSLTILCGLVFGLILFLIVDKDNGAGVEGIPQFQPRQFAHVFTLVLLPPIIFAAGFTMKKRNFLRNLGSISVFAVFGTVVSTISIGMILYSMTLNGILPDKDNGGLDVSFGPASALLVGTLLSATDPVATLAVFQELGVDPMLYSLVFGESVLNDAIAIVLFRVLRTYVERPFTAGTVGIIFLDFVWQFVGSVLFGIICSVFSAVVLRRFGKHLEPFQEVSIMLIGAYLSYLTAEALNLSGILALFLAGIMMAHYHWYSLSNEGKISILHVTNSLAFLTETIVFLSIGLALFELSFDGKAWDPRFILMTIFMTLVSRALNVFPLSALLNRFRAHATRIRGRHQFLLWFSGMRGAIALILALSVNLNASCEIGVFHGEDLLVNTTLLIVLITNVLVGPATTPLIRCLNIDMGPENRMVRTVTDHDHPNIEVLDSTEALSVPLADPTASVGNYNASGVPLPVRSAGLRQRSRGTIKKYWERFDDRLIKPWLGGRERHPNPHASRHAAVPGGESEDGDAPYDEVHHFGEHHTRADEDDDGNVVSRSRGSTLGWEVDAVDAQSPDDIFKKGLVRSAGVMISDNEEEEEEAGVASTDDEEGESDKEDLLDIGDV